MKIRKASLQDVIRILEIQKVAYKAEAEIYNDFSIPPLHENEKAIQEDLQVSRILVAEKGEVVGSVRGKDTGETIVISRLSVHPDWQGKGIGKALMSGIMEAFPCKSFELFTGHKSERNIRLYEALGFIWCRSEKISERLTLYWMRKNIECES